ncbi:hypothetical protein LXL04_028899 [Taraxacum kok-saghyz]
MVPSGRTVAQRINVTLGITNSSSPRAYIDEKRYVSYVQNVVRQFGPYTVWTLEHGQIYFKMDACDLQTDAAENVAPTLDNVEDRYENSVKKRKFTSDVWNDFERITKTDGSQSAKCIHCRKQLVAANPDQQIHSKGHLISSPATTIPKAFASISKWAFLATQRNAILLIFNFPKPVVSPHYFHYRFDQFSSAMAEDVGCWKLAAQYIQRQLKEADEVNLLDEEDMHVFGLRPMMDPLILVCCDSCKKPVKVSQYATHTEICKSLTSVIDNTKERGLKKPPRKERKKLQNAISSILIMKLAILIAQVALASKPEIPNSTASNSHVDEQTLNPISYPIQAKGVSGVPAPLATKIFYSQRTQRLRSAISHMFYRSSSTHLDHGLLCDIQFSDDNKMPSLKSTHGYFHENKTDDPHVKGGEACTM